MMVPEPENTIVLLAGVVGPREPPGTEVGLRVTPIVLAANIGRPP